MENKKVVSFVGPMGSGKTTACNVLEDLGYERLSHAGSLKDEAMRYFGLTAHQVYTQEGKLESVPICEIVDHINESDCPEPIKRMSVKVLGSIRAIDITSRKVLQLYGTEIIKPLYGDDYWVKRTLDKIKNSEKEYFCIDDTRFIVERETLGRNLHHIVSVGITRNLSAIAGGVSADLHQSELEMVENWSLMTDFTIINDGSVDQLKTKLLFLDAILR